jgi:hypothetical protein
MGASEAHAEGKSDGKPVSGHKYSLEAERLRFYAGEKPGVAEFNR